jgi:hypothetical protein
MIDYGNILTLFYSNNNWRIENSFEYNTLNWYDQNKPTQEELDSQWEEVQSIIAKNKCKSKAQILLNESDFTDLYSVRNKLENIKEWDTYRDIIRELRINPIENPIFPDKPQTIWKQTILPIPIEEMVVPIEEPMINNEETTI